MRLSQAAYGNIRLAFKEDSIEDRSMVVSKILEMEILKLSGSKSILNKNKSKWKLIQQASKVMEMMLIA